jgi:fermentation-respiration switch protein FrsA (DUF1100 family)
MALAKALLLAAAIGYLAIALLLWAAQERLIFFPVPLRGPAAAPPGWRLESVVHAATDGTRLAGILLLPPQAKPPLVIYYGGNAGEVTAYAAEARDAYGPRALLLMNYRGYGESQGRPGERALIADALELYDAVAARGEIDRERIAVHGRSLGTGVAVAVAAARPVKCVVLTSPFASAREVASEIYPWLPIAMMLRHPFDSGALASGIKVPALVLAGEADNVIPKRHSDRLAQRWGGPVERRSFPGFGHNDLELHPGYREAILGFLERSL